MDTERTRHTGWIEVVCGSMFAGDVVLTTEIDGASVRKTFSFTPADYLIRVGYDVHNQRSTAMEVGLFAQLKRDSSEPFGQSGTPLGPAPYLGAALTTPEERYLKLEFDDLDDAPYRQEVTGGWIAILQHYFLGAWVAHPETQNRYYGQKRDAGTYIVGFTGPVATIAPGARGRYEASFYAGPKDQAELEAVAPNLNLTVDYGFLWWLAVPLFLIMKWIHGVVGNWGVSIPACANGVMWLQNRTIPAP